MTQHRRENANHEQARALAKYSVFKVLVDKRQQVHCTTGPGLGAGLFRHSKASPAVRLNSRGQGAPCPCPNLARPTTKEDLQQILSGMDRARPFPTLMPRGCPGSGIGERLRREFIAEQARAFPN
jgi:hypothetical protein